MVTPNNPIEEIKRYLQETVGVQLSMLTKQIDQQASTLRHIELTTTTRQAEQAKDIQSLKEKIIEIEINQKATDESQKIYRRELEKRLDSEKEEQQKKEIEAGKMYDRVGFMIKLLWIFISLAATLIGTAIFQRLAGG